MDINIKIAIISLILVATLALATVCFLRIKFYRRVNKIALYIFEEIKDIQKIEDAITFVSDYKMKLKDLRKDVAKCQKLYKEEFMAGSFLNFGHKKRLEDFSKELEIAKTAQDEFEMKNKNEYHHYLTILESIDMDFYNINKERIINALEKMNHDAAIEQQRKLEDAAIEQQRKLEEQEQNRREMIENIQREREIKNKQIEEKEKKDSVSKSIQELENCLSILQANVREKLVLDFQILKFIEDTLDKIEDNRTFINTNDFNNIKRIQKKLNSIFERFKNDEFVKPNIEIIEKSLYIIIKSRK
jgi:hypothetical protein